MTLAQAGRFTEETRAGNPQGAEIVHDAECHDKFLGLHVRRLANNWTIAVLFAISEFFVPGWFPRLARRSLTRRMLARMPFVAR